jgi:acyl-coenzyme A synthetase/AMP-(fatty) acid ligase
MDMGDLARTFDEDLPQEAPVPIEDLGPEDPAAIVFTSGTTGEPRGVVYPQRYLGGQRLQAEHWFGAREGEVAWCTAAPGWSKSTRNAFIAPWLCGAVAVLHDGRFDPHERLRLCEELGVNVLCQAPTEYRMLAAHGSPAPVPALRRLVSAGEPIEPEVIRLFRRRLGPAIGDGYGQTETGAISGMPPGEDDPARDGSMGRPLPGIETRIVDGELQLRASSSPTFFARYLDGEGFDGEWWPTGDRVREDDAGYLWFEGRSDDLILSSGYRIGPFEVESALVSHPAVAEAAAVAAPDPERGSVVRAIVVLNDAGPTPSPELAAELQEHVKGETAPYKYPRIVEFAEGLPKTRSGKIKRAELRHS